MKQLYTIYITPIEEYQTNTNLVKILYITLQNVTSLILSEQSWFNQLWFGTLGSQLLTNLSQFV